jgi:hypothetical protein
LRTFFYQLYETDWSEKLCAAADVLIKTAAASVRLVADLIAVSPCCKAFVILNIFQMNTNKDFQPAIVRTMTHRICGNIVQLNHLIQDSADGREALDFMAALIVHNAALNLLAIATVTEDKFFIQQSINILNK